MYHGQSERAVRAQEKGVTASFLPPSINRRIFFYIYFVMIFEKINGRTKIFEKCTFGVVAHGGWLLPPYPGVLSPCRRVVPAPGRAIAAVGLCRRVARRQTRTVVPHGDRVFLVFDF
jgi:hypothetical protein